MSPPRCSAVTTSALRMAFGGHFFTDVAAAGLVNVSGDLAGRTAISIAWPSTRLSDARIDAALTRLGWPGYRLIQRWARARCGARSVGVNACASTLSAYSPAKFVGRQIQHGFS